MATVVEALAEKRNAKVRGKAATAMWCGYSGVVLTLLAALCTWLTVHNVANIGVVLIIATFLRGAFLLFALVSGVGLAVAVFQTLAALRDRAIHAQPQLSRSATQLHVMHMWPVRNIVGPIEALVESGVHVARGPGRLLWVVAYLLWPLGVVWFALSDLAVSQFRALIVIAVAFLCTALTASLLKRALQPEESHRIVPAPPQPVGKSFWSDGVIVDKPRVEPRVVEAPIDDGLEAYYRPIRDCR